MTDQKPAKERSVAQALRKAGFTSAKPYKPGFTCRQSELSEGVVLVGWRSFDDRAGELKAKQEMRAALAAAGFDLGQADATAVLRVTGKRSGDAR